MNHPSEKSMKQNKKFLAIILVVFILVSCASFSAFAYTDNSTNGVDFTGQPIPVVSSLDQNSIVSAGFAVGTDSSGYTYYVASLVDDVYVCTYPDGSDFVPYYLSPTQFTKNDVGIVSSENGSSVNLGLNASYNSTYDIYTCTRILYMKSTLVPNFNNSTSCAGALRDWLDNPPIPPALTGGFTSTIEPGYAMYIDITNLNVSVNLTQSTPVGYYGLGATQFAGVTDSIPDPITQNSIGTVINWSGTGRADSFGQYTSWYSNITASGITSGHNHAYFAIINPLQNNSMTGSLYDNAVANGIINITISNSNSVKIYPLSTSFNAGVYNSTSGDVSASGHADGQGGLTYTNDVTGDAYTQEFGGLTNPENTATTVNEWLENIAGSIGGFFKGAIGAVSTLVSAGRDFFGVLVGLYSWLPPAVLSVLSSAMIVVITVGVVKVFI